MVSKQLASGFDLLVQIVIWTFQVAVRFKVHRSAQMQSNGVSSVMALNKRYTIKITQVTVGARSALIFSISEASERRDETRSCRIIIVQACDGYTQQEAKDNITRSKEHHCGCATYRWFLEVRLQQQWQNVAGNVGGMLQKKRLSTSKEIRASCVAT